MRINRVTDYLDITAERLPDKVAYLDSSREMTFKEMREEAYKIASAIAKTGNFKKPVGIFLPQVVETVSAIMGVAYSGNFYSVLDVEMPASRIEKILDTFEPVAIITNKANEEKAKALEGDFQIIVYEDAVAKELTDKDAELVDTTKQKVIETDILYVLFTSGSTGMPKGVVQPHRSVIAQHEWLSPCFGIDETRVFCNQAPFYFVMSTLEIFQCIKTGCTVCIPPRMAFAFPGMLIEFMNEHQVDIVYWVPTLLCLLANLGALEEEKLPPIRTIMPSGEVMPIKQMNMWLERYPDVQIVNQYGPTEMADICAYYIVDRKFKETESLPIGKPASYMDIMILGADDKPVKDGEVGELCGRGPSLAYGYYKNPEKTAEAFVQNPLVDTYEEKIYRSGDLVKVNERGEMIYVTRKDFQIKHMGHRIELGEIETAASSLEGMERSCCVYDDERKMIVMFYTGGIEAEQIIEGLRNLVPEYMIPNRIEKMTVLPTNLNGKIDRAKLKSSLK